MAALGIPAELTVEVVARRVETFCVSLCTREIPDRFLSFNQDSRSQFDQNLLRCHSEASRSETSFSESGTVGNIVNLGNTAAYWRRIPRRKQGFNTKLGGCLQRSRIICLPGIKMPIDR